MAAEPKIIVSHDKPFLSIEVQVNKLRSQFGTNNFKKVLVIDSFIGYGSDSKIKAAFSGTAAKIGVIFEEPPTSSWINLSTFFDEFAAKKWLCSETVQKPKYFQELKDEVIQLIKWQFGKVDMVIYRLAAPQRINKKAKGYNSVHKTSRNDTEIPLTSSTKEEIHNTVKGIGEEWKDWIESLMSANAMEKYAMTFIGPNIQMYSNSGSICYTRNYLFKTSDEINMKFNEIRACVAL